MAPKPPPHFCPGCGAEQKPFLRYPWHFCNDCRALAVDRGGRRLRFGNTDFGGGFYAAYVDEDHGYPCSHARCRIGGRPVIVHEARFGGVVAEPIPDMTFGDAFRDVIDFLTFNVNLAERKTIALMPRAGSDGNDPPGRG